MPYLHEVIAVEPDLKERSLRRAREAIALFKDGQDRFLGKVITYEMDEGQDERFPEETQLSITVDQTLDLVFGSFSGWTNAALTKEFGNQEARADIIVDGGVLVSDVPVTALLNLEAKLEGLKAVVLSIPTNDPAEVWTYDDENGFFRSKIRQAHVTAKQSRVEVLYEATPEHPAQTELITFDGRAGVRSTTLFSGMYTPRQKRDMLEKLEKLIEAVKSARQRANTTEVAQRNIASVLIDYIRE